MGRHRRARSVWLAASLSAVTVVAAAMAGGCGEPCDVVPTTVELLANRVTGQAPLDLQLLARPTLGAVECGPVPQEIVSYEWRLDGALLDVDPEEDLIVLTLDTPGVYEASVQVFDDTGASFPAIDRLTIVVF